jgi:mono/diheme cytochrome c family protein
MDLRKNKYLLLASSVGSFALLLTAAVQENFFQEWRSIQKSARTEEGPIRVQLRQVVNPALGISDRCVSCHVSMAPGEQGVVGQNVQRPHPAVFHDPAEFGCTVCHGGQGRATQRADAHGEVEFWPEPMLPREFSQAGCGTCHVAPGTPSQDLYHHAALAFERLDCLACHRVDGRGATLRPNGQGMEGPDLSAAAIRGYDRAWYSGHLKKSAEASAGPWRTSFAPVSDQDLKLLTVFLDTRVGASKWVEAKSVFLSAGCLGCHKVSGVGGDEGPELTRAGLKDPGQLAFGAVPGGRTLKNWMAEHFRSPLAVVASSQMPPVRRSDSEIEMLTFYTLSLRRKDLPGAYLPKDRIRTEKFGERDFAGDGATLFGAFCSGCHGVQGQGMRAAGVQNFSSIANPDFLSLASDEFLLETLRRGRPGRKMPAWGEMDGWPPTPTAAGNASTAICGSTTAGSHSSAPQRHPQLPAASPTCATASSRASDPHALRGGDRSGGQPDDPRWDPRVCQKGLALTRRFYGDRRVNQCMVRAGFKRWYEAGFPRARTASASQRVLPARPRRVGPRLSRRGGDDRGRRPQEYRRNL